MRGIFFEESTARLVAGRLRRDGWTAATEAEPLAGEDNDEDHPWAVTTDAPEAALDLLVETYDGWLEPDEPAVAEATPVTLPAAPVRRRQPTPDSNSVAGS